MLLRHLKIKPLINYRSISIIKRTLATETSLAPTDPVELYRAKVALGLVKYDDDQSKFLNIYNYLLSSQYKFKL